MAAANTSDDPKDSFAAWLAQQMTPEQAAASSGPVTQAPTADHQQKSGKFPGQYDQYRSQRPSDIPEDWWSSYIDAMNYEYSQGYRPDDVGNITQFVAKAYRRGSNIQELQKTAPDFAPSMSLEQAQKAAPTAGAAPAFDPVAGAKKLNSDTQAAITAGKAQDAETWKGVQPSIDAVTTARDNQVAGDRQAESDLGAAGQKYVSDLAATQAQRESGGAAADAAQTGLFNTLRDSNNANNNLLTGANNTLQGELGAQSTQASGVAAQLSQQLAGLNDEDKAAYLKYIGQTDPLLAKMVAQASDPKYVKQQQDVYDQYKAQSTPEVTAQERYLAELARRKTENDDKSSRDAVDQDLATRGLRSGGQVIAGQYANRQNTAQDRVLAELGVQANAVGRAQTNLAGAAGVAGQLRNADDAMKQFSDQYAQNDAIRRQNVAQGQVNTGLATTKQRGDRNEADADFQRGVINENTGRSENKFNSTLATTSANSGRDKTTYDGGTQSIGLNWDRDEGVRGHADANGGIGYDIAGKAATLKTSDLAGEVGSAGSAAGTVMTAAQIKMLKDQGWTDAEIQAYKEYLGNQIAGSVQAPSAAASNN